VKTRGDGPLGLDWPETFQVPGPTHVEGTNEGKKGVEKMGDTIEQQGKKPHDLQDPRQSERHGPTHKGW